VQEVTARGETKSSVRFESGLQADLRIVPNNQFVFALHHFTGSKNHNVQMRQRALARGLSLSEWGLVPAEGEGTVKEKAAKGSAADTGKNSGGAPSTGNAAAALSGPHSAINSESDLFASLGLAFIPPELREGLGEIEVAEENQLPQLVELGQIRGTFHCHTTASDGRNTLLEMVAAAEALGWDYFGVADHSKSSVQAKGLTEERLLKQIDEIADLNRTKRFHVRVFAGTECDILPDGQLDYDDALLAKLDYVVASVHSTFSQDEATMTARIIRAIEHPRTTMLGHLTGRLLLRREGYRVDAAKVIDAAIASGVIIELNASPWRVEMDWRLWRKAAERGLVCSINPDAHETGDLDYVRTGVNIARKGWLTKEHVFNTRTLAEVEKYFASQR
jgi:DNA polymerase (family 10)